jgi:transcriptional regulator with XRE-family HTH domain
MSDAQDLFREANVKVGALGARRRTELGLTSMDFAVAVGVSVSSLSSFEHGYGDAPQHDMGLIEQGLGWKLGTVERVIGDVRTGRIHPDRIVMEHLDGEGWEL